MVNTVLGAMLPGNLGFTLMHEHLLCSDWVKRTCWPGFFEPEEALDKICAVVQRAKDAGVQTIVDATPPNLGRDIEVLRNVAKRTGVNIIASTGSYATEDKWLQRISEDGLLHLYLQDIEQGMQCFDCKAGVIKCATDKDGFTEENQKMLRVAARAQKLSGLPVLTHCRPPGLEIGLRQQEIFAAEGANLEKMVIGHFRNGDSLEYGEAVLRRGSYLAIDQMNWQERNLEYNIDVIKAFLRHGWGGKLLFSHDAVVCYNYEHWQFKSSDDYVDFAPNMLSYLKESAWGKMVKAGIDETALQVIFYENPKRLFS